MNEHLQQKQHQPMDSSSDDTETKFELPGYEVAVGGHYSLATGQEEAVRSTKMEVEDD